jgi:hypothetical protein
MEMVDQSDRSHGPSDEETEGNDHMFESESAPEEAEPLMSKKVHMRARGVEPTKVQRSLR